ncbi:MAG: VOC family protein [Spirochaetia bacterium]|jgi:catechol 2,3-dioxygenase-like lactoylglutathione lyase family enzyme|nr:VOC family protein [Spirochaetia bacterium]MCE1208032.1 VOC family protein [Spirochaetia bacterium]
MILGFNHFSFTVRDVDKSVEHYEKNLGFSLISLADRPAEYVFAVTGMNMGMKIAYLKGYGVVIELIEYFNTDSSNVLSKPSNIGSGHLCLNVDDIHDSVKNLKEKGVNFLGEPVIIPAGANKGGYVVYSLDPDGIVNEFIQAPKT